MAGGINPGWPHELGTSRTAQVLPLGPSHRASARWAMSVRDPPTSSIAMLTPNTASAPSAFASSPTPTATPKYADAGMVVTEIATPTAELALVSSASIPATPAANATIGVEILTVDRPARN